MPLTKQQIRMAIDQVYAQKEPPQLNPKIPLKEISEALGGKKKDGIKELLAKVKARVDARDESPAEPQPNPSSSPSATVKIDAQGKPIGQIVRELMAQGKKVVAINIK